MVKFILIVLLLVGGVVFGWPALLRTVYPTPYRETVLKVADQYQLDPALIYAVMFEESHFNTQAKSPKGAIGLMQILPDTGRFIATSLGHSGFTEQDLTDPTINITFGSWYLQYLLDRAKGNVTQSVMAYNGGEAAAKSATPPAESVTFAERVLATKKIYQQLYSAQFHATPKPTP